MNYSHPKGCDVSCVEYSKQTRRAVLAVVDEWRTLPESKRGLHFDESVERLQKWAEELEKEEEKERLA